MTSELDKLTQELVAAQSANKTNSQARHAAGREEDGMPLEAMETFLRRGSGTVDTAQGNLDTTGGVSQHTAQNSRHPDYRNRW